MPLEFLGKLSFQQLFLDRAYGLPRLCVCWLLMLGFVACPTVLTPLHAKPVIPQAREDDDKKNGPGLQYKWRPGDVHQYEISVKAKVADEVEEYRGVCQMSVGPLWTSLVRGIPASEKSAKVDAVDEFDREFSGINLGDDSTPVKLGTGTAFSISSKGHLLTCAHVVDGADEITVTINDKKMPAKVILLDTENDLAVLKLKKGSSCGRR